MRALIEVYSETPHIPYNLECFRVPKVKIQTILASNEDPLKGGSKPMLLEINMEEETGRLSDYHLLRQAFCELPPSFRGGHIWATVDPQFAKSACGDGLRRALA